MRLVLTRDSVAAGDDIDAPHERALADIPPVATLDGLERLIRQVVGGNYLASVAGRATWAAFSNLPLAVYSNLAEQPRMIWLTDRDVTDRLNVRDGTLRMHFVYLAMVDPDTAFDVLRSIRSAWQESD